MEQIVVVIKLRLHIIEVVAQLEVPRDLTVQIGVNGTVLQIIPHALSVMKFHNWSLRK